jgi:hypothetical protein
LAAWIVFLLALFVAFAAWAQPISPYRAVLVAGERDAPVFDRAIDAMRTRLLAHGVADSDIAAFSATRMPPATGRNVLTAIAALHPAPGQACFVFVTSHGGEGLGLVLAPREEFLTPTVLDRAVTAGCGDAPTVVIASGCYSGSFARSPLAKPNRIVLTAARADRPSFGCGVEFDYTVFDRCLLDAMDADATWHDVADRARSCVAAAEHALRFPASGPRTWLGAGVRGMKVFGGG